MNLGTDMGRQKLWRGTRAAWIFCGVAVFAISVVVGLRLRYGSALQVPDGVVSAQFLAEARRDWESGRFSEVANRWHTVPDDHEFAADARFLQGRALWKLNRWQAAEGMWKRALELDPRVPEAGWHLLRFYYVEHRWREAEELALKLYEVEPDPRDQSLLLLELIRIEHERLTPAETAIMLEPVIALEPENYHALRIVGFSYVQLKRVSEGLALIEQSLKLEPMESETWFALASCLDLVGDLKRLGELWQDIPQAVRQEPRMLRMRGLWAESIGDFAEAESNYRRVLEGDPVHGKAHYELARVLHRRGAEPEADEHERISKQIDKTRDRMGTCYAEATRLNDNPTVELCHELSQLYRELNRPRHAELWQQEATRRSSTGRQSCIMRLPSFVLRVSSDNVALRLRRAEEIS
jgi:tetratricopeptide (TPR) repeat protein